MSAEPHFGRVEEAAALLVGGAPRAEVALPLLTLVGLCGRPSSSPAERRLREHALEALLWLGAHRSRARVASALERGWRLAAPRGGPPGAGWAERLEMRRRGGPGDALERLAELLLTRGATTGAGGDDAPLEWRMALEVEAGGARTRVAAGDFVAIERGVRWVGAPRELIGVAGGTPLRAVTPLVFGDGAVRFRWAREEVLAPFGTLRVVEEG